MTDGQTDVPKTGAPAAQQSSCLFHVLSHGSMELAMVLNRKAQPKVELSGNLCHLVTKVGTVTPIRSISATIRIRGH